jgi:aminoglycoside phosphotransferase (APT) family kinase protein
MLTGDEVVEYLRERTLIDPGAAGALDVTDMSRRNRNVRVLTDPGVGFFVKQGVGPDRAVTVANEADTYHRLVGRAESSGMDRYLPRYFDYDPLRHVLVLGLVPGSQSLHEYHATRGRFSVTLARALGDALGNVHTVGEPDKENDGHSQIGRAPWVLSLHRPDLGVLHSLSGATIELVTMLQQIPDLCDQLDLLQLQWKATTLIHNDVRWDNCLVFAAPNTGRVTRLKLVDWELSGAGDPLWDVGCAFSEYLAFWLTSIPITGDAPPDRYLHLSRHPIEQMQPAIRSLWESYLLRVGIDPAESMELLQLAVRYAAARLVQSAFERTQHSAWVTSDVICLLQLGLNILQEPNEAATTLLGIPVNDRGRR